MLFATKMHFVGHIKYDFNYKYRRIKHCGIKIVDYKKLWKRFMNIMFPKLKKRPPYLP